MGSCYRLFASAVEFVEAFTIWVRLSRSSSGSNV